VDPSTWALTGGCLSPPCSHQTVLILSMLYAFSAPWPSRDGTAHRYSFVYDPEKNELSLTDNFTPLHNSNPMLVLVVRVISVLLCCLPRLTGSYRIYSLLLRFYRLRMSFQCARPSGLSSIIPVPTLYCGTWNIAIRRFYINFLSLLITQRLCVVSGLSRHF
jgi:hypothetical protein